MARFEEAMRNATLAAGCRLLDELSTIRRPGTSAQVYTGSVIMAGTLSAAFLLTYPESESMDHLIGTRMRTRFESSGVTPTDKDLKWAVSVCSLYHNSFSRLPVDDLAELSGLGRRLSSVADQMARQNAKSQAAWSAGGFEEGGTLVLARAIMSELGLQDFPESLPVFEEVKFREHYEEFVWPVVMAIRSEADLWGCVSCGAYGAVTFGRFVRPSRRLQVIGYAHRVASANCNEGVGRIALLTKEPMALSEGWPPFDEIVLGPASLLRKMRWNDRRF